MANGAKTKKPQIGEPTHRQDAPVSPRASEAGVPASAVASLVLGVAGVLTSFTVVPGAICGIAAAALSRHAANQTGPDAGRPGRGYAIAGQATGGLAILLSAVFGLVFVLGAVDTNNRQGAEGGCRTPHSSVASTKAS
ncbi:MAG: hypothetical protein AAGA29_03760 [Planctomycetota bacterium]